MGLTAAELFYNMHIYLIADWCKFTYYYLLFKIALFGKLRKCFDFI